MFIVHWYDLWRCGVRPSRSRHRRSLSRTIQGGSEAQAHSWPWVVSLRYVRTPFATNFWARIEAFRKDICCHIFEPTCAHARWALMHHFLSGVCLWAKIRLEKTHISKSIIGGLPQRRLNLAQGHDIGRWADANVKLHFFQLLPKSAVFPYLLPVVRSYLLQVTKCPTTTRAYLSLILLLVLVVSCDQIFICCALSDTPIFFTVSSWFCRPAL